MPAGGPSCSQGEQPSNDGIDSRSSSKSPTKTVRRKPRKPLRIHLSNCKYELLRRICRKLGWKEVSGDDEEWDLYWTDTSVGLERVMRLRKGQKINHLCGMLELCRKKSMARNLSKMASLFPKQYSFFPKTYLLPEELDALLSELSKNRSLKRKRTFILKPDSGCQGRGIRLVQTADAARSCVKDLDGGTLVAQRYIGKPLLINGLKFDMRIYVLVLSCDPLRMFIFTEGLVRFCTEKYVAPNSSNLDTSYMHLTNYSLNKHHSTFVFNRGSHTDGEGSKWTLAALWQHLQEQGHDPSVVWARICDMLVKSLISVQPILQYHYRAGLPHEDDGFSCFELLGFDVMLDRDLRPWLLESNHSPSFNTDTPLDAAVKEALITDAITLVRLDRKSIRKAKKEAKRAANSRLFGSASSSGARLPGPPKQQELGAEEQQRLREVVLRKREKWEAEHMGGYQRVFPAADAERQSLYEQLLQGAQHCFQSTAYAKLQNNLQHLAMRRKQKEEEEEAMARAQQERAALLRERLAMRCRNQRSLRERHSRAIASAAPASSSSSCCSSPEPRSCQQQERWAELEGEWPSHAATPAGCSPTPAATPPLGPAPTAELSPSTHPPPSGGEARSTSRMARSLSGPFDLCPGRGRALHQQQVATCLLQLLPAGRDTGCGRDSGSGSSMTTHAEALPTASNLPGGDAAAAAPGSPCSVSHKLLELDASLSLPSLPLLVLPPSPLPPAAAGKGSKAAPRVAPLPVEGARSPRGISIHGHSLHTAEPDSQQREPAPHQPQAQDLLQPWLAERINAAGRAAPLPKSAAVPSKLAEERYMVTAAKAAAALRHRQQAEGAHADTCGRSETKARRAAARRSSKASAVARPAAGSATGSTDGLRPVGCASMPARSRACSHGL